MDSAKQADGSKAAPAPADTDAGAGAGAAGPRDDVPAQEEANNGCGEDAVDDEQVERFFALLANIRAMRRLYMPGPGVGGDHTTSASGGKRSRSAAAGPWRPAFRMEDFDDDDATSRRCVRMKEEGSSQQQQPDDPEKGDGAGRPVVTQPSPRAGARRTDTGGSNSI